MGSMYVDIGIDHGTTNSAIAIMEKDGPYVIKPDGFSEVMPSVVYMNRRGRAIVGTSAYNAMLESHPEDGDGHTGYKPDIGQGGMYEFRAASAVKSAPELGSMVIGALLKAHQGEFGRMPEAAVITVPAKFEQSACEATREAARLAGLKYTAQLQEPIAAALVSGFSCKDERAQWMIFDLGGGTLDVSLVVVRKGQMSVPEKAHAGEVDLGGRLFDRAIYDHVIQQLRRQYSLKSFGEGNRKYKPAWGRLMLAIEQAKIGLSSRDEARVEVDSLCEDERGEPVNVGVPITRKQYEGMIAANVLKTVHICKMLLDRNRLTANDIQRLILVGGPTKTPYVQEVLRSRLRIPFSFDVDPMTAVAQGAAIYASAHEIPDEYRSLIALPEKAQQGAVGIQLQYERASKVPVCEVMGVVEGADKFPGGVTVQIDRKDRRWTSGPLPVDEGGIFSAEVVLDDKEESVLWEFQTTAFDAQGRALASVDEPQIRYPWMDTNGAMKVANSILVQLHGNAVEKLIGEGAHLPARGRSTFQTTKPLHRGGKEDVLQIPLLEAVTHLLGGEDEHADCHLRIGALRILGSDERVHRDVPAGADVDVTVRFDESRNLRVVAYVTLLDEEFEATFESGTFGMKPEDIEERFGQVKELLGSAEELQKAKPDADVGRDLDALKELKTVAGIEHEIRHAREGGQDALSRACRRTLELAGAVNSIRAKQQAARIEHNIERLKRAASGASADTVAKAERDFAAAGRSGDAAQLNRVEENLANLDVHLRLRPLIELFLDCSAFPPTFRGTPEQLQAYREGEKLVLGIVEGGGKLEDATADQIALAQRYHDRLMQLWPELPKWRQQDAEARLAKGLGDSDVDLSTITKRG